jgi:hypothetical protein
MKLQKSKNKVPQELKDKIKNLIDGFSIETMEKTDINSENYKAPEKEPELVKTEPGLNLGSIKKELIAPITNIINEKLKNISFHNSKNVNYLTTDNYFNSVNKEYKNFSTNSTEQKTSKYLNIDYKNLFSPSQETQKNISNKFYDNKTNIKNLTQTTNLIPALKEGGVVKEPTVAYLHENEAVVPLKESKTFQNFIQTLTKGSLVNNTKNESIKNVSSMRNNTTNIENKTSVENKNITNKSQKEQPISLNAPISINQQLSGSPSGMNKPNLPLVYAGSGSNGDLFSNSVNKPKWRKNTG